MVAVSLLSLLGRRDKDSNLSPNLGLFMGMRMEEEENKTMVGGVPFFFYVLMVHTTLPRTGESGILLTFTLVLYIRKFV